MNNEFDITYNIYNENFEITSIPKYELYEIIKREINDSDIGLIKLVIDKSKRALYNSKDYKRDKHWGSHNSNIERIEFKVRFEDFVEKYFGSGGSSSGINFVTDIIDTFNPNEKYNFKYSGYAAKDMFSIYSAQNSNLLRRIRKGNKMFIKASISGRYRSRFELRIPASRFMKTGLNQREKNQLNKYQYYELSVVINLKRKTENTIFDGETYMEFSLKGSTKALNVD